MSANVFHYLLFCINCEGFSSQRGHVPFERMGVDIEHYKIVHNSSISGLTEKSILRKNALLSES